MKKHINKKKSNIIKKMNKKKIVMILSVMIFFNIFMFFSVNADDVVLKYEFEENGGNLILDSNGNGFTAINNNMDWVTNSVFGNYAGEFDGLSDYIEVTMPIGELTSFCMGGWIYPYDIGVSDNIVYIQSGNSSLLDFYYDNSSINFRYRDDSQNLQDFEIDNTPLTENTYTHISLCIDSVEEKYIFFRDGAKINNGTIPNGYNSFSNPQNVMIGSDYTETYKMDGVLDSIYVTDFFTSEEQVSEMISQNKITIEEIPTETNETNLKGNIKTDLIIDNYIPYQNYDFVESEKINLNLNANANCEFYVDNSLYKKGFNKTAYSWTHDLQVGSYTGFFNCYYIYNNTRYYDLTETFDFNVVLGDNSLITFQLDGNDFNVADENLYVFTPCIQDVRDLGLKSIANDIEKILNDNKSVKFKQVQNDVVTFNLTPEEHEFCIINGQLEYDSNNYTDNYNLNNIEGFINLGEFNIPSNATQSYSISLDLIDVYYKTNPKAWGQTWASIIGGLILFVFGSGLLFAGVFMGNGKIVIGGVILCLSAFGIGLNGIFGVLI